MYERAGALQVCYIECVKLSLRARLTFMYSALVALTLAAFAVVAYFTVSSELNENLDASLSRVAASLETVIRKEQQAAKRPLMPLRRDKRTKTPERTDDFAFLNRVSARDVVGPVLPPENETQLDDPVWSAVYEHMLLNSSNYLIQVNDRQGVIVWRSDNLQTDSLPLFSTFEQHGAKVVDDRIHTYYTLGGIRYRLVLYRGGAAEVAAAYPAGEVDATLRRLFSLMLYGMPVAMLLSSLAGWFLAQRSLRPVDEITLSARKITAKNLAQRLPMPPTNDEIARLTETLNEMIARLETSFTRIRQFTSDASHELKTPLAILMGELEIALRRPMTAHEYRETLESCLEEVERLTSLVQGLLDLSRADTGQVMVDRKPLRLSALVEDICDDVIILAEQKRIVLDQDIQPHVMVDGDRVRLHQALLNVIENAVKYTPDEGMVRVQLRKNDSDAVIIVADTGIGIPAGDTAFIFDRFYRVDKARSKSIQGTGLGLAIVKWIVDAHDGTIDVHSEEGRGTTFTISLPLRREEAASA